MTSGYCLWVKPRIFCFFTTFALGFLKMAGSQKVVLLVQSEASLYASVRIRFYRLHFDGPIVERF